MKPSRYLENVRRAVDAVGQDLIIQGNYLLVEVVPKEELKSSSGLIMSVDTGRQRDSLSANLPTWVHVLAIGSGYYSETDESDVPLETAPGDILLVGEHSVKRFPVYPVNGYEAYSIGITSEAEVQMRFRGIEAYRRYAEALNRGT